MPRQGKKYLEARGKVNREAKYSLDESLDLLKETARAKFDETVEVAMRLGVDPKDPDQQVRGSVVLPKGTGKSVRVLVFAKGEKVKEAEDAETIRSGSVYVAPGGTNLTVRRQGDEVLAVVKARNESDKYVPSVDALMRSVAAVYGYRCLAVILTGMGDDGMEGVLEVKSRQGLVIAESEETSVIFGMPRKAISTGAVDRVLPLFKISEAIVDLYLTVR